MARNNLPKRPIIGHVIGNDLALIPTVIHTSLWTLGDITKGKKMSSPLVPNLASTPPSDN